MTKIVYNASHGGYSLSPEAVLAWAERRGIILNYHEDGYFTDAHGEAFWPEERIARDDPVLAQIVLELGPHASGPGPGSDLRVRDLKPGTVYRIHEYDGLESVLTFDEHEWRIA